MLVRRMMIFGKWPFIPFRDWENIHGCQGNVKVKDVNQC